MHSGGGPPITFTMDVEDYAPSGEEVRADAVVDRVLSLLAEHSIRGTFFVVGELAQRHPAIVRAVAAAGHEIGLHGWQHVPLADLDAGTLRKDLDRGSKLIADLTGASVCGFRAPMFSLVAQSRWAVDAIADAGFSYSSSVLPARSPLWGDPLAPRHPFRWPNGLLELPCPVATFGPIANPYLGGAYLRVLPLALVRYGLGQAAGDELLWLYCHPYDFDPDEPYRARAELGRFASRLMWLGRAGMHRRVERVLAGRSAPPLAERIAMIP